MKAGSDCLWLLMQICLEKVGRNLKAMKDGCDPRELLKALRWKAGMLVVNPFGERVWLKDDLDENGKKVGITDCCPADDPCPIHKASA